MELKEVSGGKDSSFSRPLNFYEMHLDIVLLVMILFGIVFRVLSIISIFFLSSKLCALENLINCNLCENVLDPKSLDENGNPEDEKLEPDQANKKKEEVILFINPSCESTEKESESSNKEKENIPSPESPVIQSKNIVKNVRHERNSSLNEYFKKIVK